MKYLFAVIAGIWAAGIFGWPDIIINDSVVIPGSDPIVPDDWYIGIAIFVVLAVAVKVVTDGGIK